MALALLQEESLYKILVSSSSFDFYGTKKNASINMIFIRTKNKYVRAVVNFFTDDFAGIEEFELDKENADLLIDSLCQFLEELETEADIYDLTSIDSVDRQIEVLNKVQDLKSLANILTVRRKWMLI
jgi:hypothetical protein